MEQLDDAGPLTFVKSQSIRLHFEYWPPTMQFCVHIKHVRTIDVDRQSTERETCPRLHEERACTIAL